jgi:hypothetical protein
MNALAGGQRKDRAAELPAAEARLRDLLAEAHGAIRDMDRLIREHRALMADTAHAAQDAAFRAGCEEINRFSAHFQRQMNDAAEELNQAVRGAREQVADAITPTKLVVDANGGVTIEFGGDLFDSAIPVANIDLPRSVPS